MGPYYRKVSLTQFAGDCYVQSIEDIDECDASRGSMVPGLGCGADESVGTGQSVGRDGNRLTAAG